jgi:hypothetical protein
MTQLSSNSTLFWRIFLPFFMTIAFTMLSAAAILNEDVEIFGYNGLAKKAFFLALWTLVMLFIQKTGWQMRRVEANHENFTVTDFWKNARYTWDSVERIESGRRLWISVIDIYLHESGVFGNRISFRASKSNIQEFLAKNPEMWALFGKVKGLK